MKRMGADICHFHSDSIVDNLPTLVRSLQVLLCGAVAALLDYGAGAFEFRVLGRGERGGVATNVRRRKMNPKRNREKREPRERVELTNETRLRFLFPVRVFGVFRG